MLLTAVLIQLPRALDEAHLSEALASRGIQVTGFGTTPILSAVSRILGVPVEALRLSATAHVIGDPSHAEGMLLPTGEGLGFAAWYDGSRFLIRTAGYGRSVVRRQGSAYPGQIQLSEVFFAGNAYVLAVRPLVFSHDNLGAKELHEALLSSRADAASYSGLRSDTPARLASRSELRTLATSVLPATWGHVKMIYR